MSEETKVWSFNELLTYLKALEMLTSGTLQERSHRALQWPLPWFAL